MTQVPMISVPALQESYYRDLCDQLGVALVAVDPGLVITTWNAAAGRMFGAATDSMVGTPILSIFPAERRGTAERMLRRAIDVGEGSEFEFEHRDTYGEPREFAAAIAPIAVLSERIGASVCLRDITRRIALQKDLDESRKMASLGEMAGAIAHHFNNVLGGIVTSIDYANQTHDPALTMRVLDQVNRALLRSTALVNGLLAFSEGGPRADDLCDLTELLNELADETESRALRSGIKFSLTVPKLPVTPVPRTQFFTVLRHILQNAIEAMPDGGDLRVAARVDEENVTVSVSDTGCGLDATTISRMFEPFWTTKGELCTAQDRATGLGLTIAHGIIQRMGGAIRVQSEPNQGATFEITIPRRTEPPAERSP